MHRLLQRQLAKARRPDGSLDEDALIALVDRAYKEQDDQRSFETYTQETMARELEELNQSVTAEAQARVDQILRGMRDGVLVCDDSDTIVSLNAAAAELFGLPEKDLVGARLGDRLEVEAEQRPGSAAFSARIVRPDGVRVPVEVTSSETRIGTTLSRVAIARDVSERRNQEAALRESRAFLSSIIENIPIGIVTKEVGAGMRIVQWNQAASRMYDIAPGEAIGRVASELSCGDLADATDAHEGEVRTTRQPVFVFGERCVSHTGRELIMDRQFIPLLDDQGAVSHIVMISDDVTERVNADRRLQHQQIMLSAAQSIAKLGSCLIDVPSGESVLSDQMHDLLEIPGGTRTSLEDYIDAVHPEDHAAVSAALADLYRGRSMSLEHRLRMPEGAIKYVSVHGVVSEYDAENLPRTIITTLQDVTLQKMDQNALLLAKDQAEAANRAKSAFLATMSHEIRTPMNGVLGMTSLLLDSALDAKQQRYASLIKFSAENLLVIINDVLDVSKIEAGRMEIDEGDFSPAELCDGVVELVRPRAEAKGLSIALDVVGALPASLRGDGPRIRQILVNLAGNAVKFTDKGAVTIQVTVAEDGAHRRRLRFAVKDTGIGIPPAAQARLFQEFMQVDDSATRRFGGTGLGLAISKKLVELMGGEIGVESAAGEGSTFWFTLNLAALTARPQTARAGRSSGATRPPVSAGAHVLVAEDNAVNQMVVEGYLMEAGHRVTLVSNGREALERVQAETFDLLVIDMQMPEMDGLEATRAIRALGGPCADLPIVMLTANSMESDRRRGMEAGADDYLAKPIDRQALIETVQRLALTDLPSLLAQAPEINDGQFAQLMKALGPARLRVLLEKAKTSLDVQLVEVEHGTSAGDHDRIAKAAHALRGAAGSIGLSAASRLAQALEDGLENAPDLAKRLRAEVQAGLSVLEHRVDLAS
ncbi:MAG: response regulator [Polyangiaceae bacterium]|nr:response regulator [Polyangiaceae bacterium]